MTNSENKVLGTVGALIGAILGIVVWCLIGKLGYISWIGGFAITGLSVLGYNLLAKGLSKVGIIIIAVIAIISVYVATRMNYAIVVYETFKDEGYNTSLSKCFSSVMDLVELIGYTSKFYVDLALGYVMTIVAGFSVCKKFM